MFHGVQRSGKEWEAASKWKLCDARGIRATGAGLSIAWEKVLRVEGDVRCAGLFDLVAHRKKAREGGCPEPGPRHLSLGQPIRFTSGETSDCFAVCCRKGQ